MKTTTDHAEAMALALADAIATYDPNRAETLVSAERQEAWIAALEAWRNRTLTKRDPAERLSYCAHKLNEIVEGVRYERWVGERGQRLKDTPEWCAFYVALKAIDQAG